MKLVAARDHHASGRMLENVGRSALILFGLAYDESTESRINNREFTVDFRFSLENYRRTLFDGFLTRDVDVFLCTRASTNKRAIQLLLEAYAPRRHLLLDDVDGVPTREWRTAGFGSGMHNRNLRLVAAMRLCLEHAHEESIAYGRVVVTRFDIYFTLPLRFLNVAPDAVSVSTHLSPYNAIDDNLYVLPFRLLAPFHELLAMRNLSLASPRASHQLKGLIERAISPIHFIMDQGRALPFWEQAIHTVVRCIRPHALERACRPASGPRGLDAFGHAPTFGSWEKLQVFKLDLLRRLMGAARERCASARPFRLRTNDVAADGAVLAPGTRALLTRLRTRNTAALNGSIGVVVGSGSARVNESASRMAGPPLVPVQVLSPPLRSETESNRPVTWMLRPQNLLVGHGDTPEEMRWCELLANTPRL